jgi:hypothetical protein
VIVEAFIPARTTELGADPLEALGLGANLELEGGRRGFLVEVVKIESSGITVRCEVPASTHP